MPTTLQIAGWKVEGLRCPDHEISFEQNGNVSPLTLIQMPNGTGKTTTLELLRAALSGSADNNQWDKEKVRSLRKKTNSTGRGKFQLTLLHNNRRLTILMNFDLDEGTVTYNTTVQSGIKLGFHPPIALAKFLRPEFVPFFVFDGELAERLLSRDHTNAQEAIEDLFQLKVFNLLITRVSEFWDEETQTKGAKEERGLSRRRNRVQTLKERLTLVKQNSVTAKRLLEEAQQELLKKRNKFTAAITEQREIAEKLLTAEAQLSQARSEVHGQATSVLSKMRDPQAVSQIFCSELIALKASLDKVKLPESTAREFFEELAQEEFCVCGRPLDDETRIAVRNRAKQYLGSDDVALLNSIKSDIGSLVGTDDTKHSQELTDRLESLRSLIRKEAECQTIRDRVQSEGVAENPVLEQAQAEIATLEEKVREYEAECDKFDDMSEAAGDGDTFGIKVLEQRLETAERMLAEATKTIELKDKRDVITRVLTTALENARAGISEDICNASNDRINRLMPFNQIRIEKINRCLVLQGQEGGSVGETLSVAYAFLATLYDRSDHTLPFIVDSPANPLDLAVRTKVAELIPKLTEQFIAFTISSERDGFLTPLELKAAPKTIRYLTLFRKGAVDLDESRLKNEQVQESPDGFCVIGRDFFREFHLDQEVPNGSV